MAVALVARLGFLGLLGGLLTLHQQRQHRFWDGWDNRFRDECASRDSTAESIPALVRSWEQERKNPPHQLTSTYAAIFRLLDERERAKRHDIFDGLLLLIGFCLVIVWIVLP